MAARMFAVFPLILGLALVSLAVPRMMSYGAIAPWSGTIPDALKTGIRIPTEQVQRADAAYVSALRWQPMDAELGLDSALLAKRVPAYRKPGGEGFEAAVEHMRLSLRNAARTAPDKVLVWSLLAEVDQHRGKPADSYMDFLRLSALVGPYEASSMLVRSRVILRSWTSMPADLQDVARRDMLRLWRDPYSLIETLRFYLSLDYRSRVIFRKEVLQTQSDVVKFDYQLRKLLQLKG